MGSFASGVCVAGHYVPWVDDSPGITHFGRTLKLHTHAALLVLFDLFLLPTITGIRFISPGKVFR